MEKNIHSCLVMSLNRKEEPFGREMIRIGRLSIRITVSAFCKRADERAPASKGGAGERQRAAGEKRPSVNAQRIDSPLCSALLPASSEKRTMASILSALSQGEGRRQRVVSLPLRSFWQGSEQPSGPRFLSSMLCPFHFSPRVCRRLTLKLTLRSPP